MFQLFCIVIKHAHSSTRKVKENEEYQCGDELTCRIEGDYLYIKGNGIYQGNSLDQPHSSFKYINTENAQINGFSEKAFYQETQLIEINIPAAITEIPNECFSGCVNLKTITFECDENISSIGANAFYQAPLTGSISLPALETVGDKAFYETKITQFVAPELTSIGESAFFGTQLESFNIPEDLGIIGANAFTKCTNLKTFTVDTGNTFFKSIENKGLYNYNGDTLIAYPSAEGEIVIDGNVQTIEEGAFTATQITKVTIPSTCTRINNAFNQCEQLRSLEISASTEVVSSFAECGITTLTLTATASEVKFVPPQSFQQTVTSLTLSGDWTELSISFENYGNLQTVTIPTTLTTVCDNAFSGCSLLESFNIAQLQTIGANAFSGCSQFTSITFGSSLRSVGANAFSNCRGVRSVIVPYSITNAIISLTVFENLKKIEFTPSNNYNTFSYTLKDGERLSVETIVFPDTISELPECAFMNYVNLEEITIPQTVTAIPRQCFYNCAELENIVLSGKISSIGESAFANTKIDDLRFASLGETVTCAENAFSECSIHKLEITCDGSAAIPSQMLISTIEDLHITAQSIGQSVDFSKLTNLESLELLGVTSAPENCLSQLTKLRKIKVTGSGEFSLKLSSPSVTEIELQGFTSIGDFAFRGFSSLNEFEIQAQITKIGEGSFSQCTKLSKIKIPSTVTSVGKNAFEGCTGLRNVEIPTTSALTQSSASRKAADATTTFDSTSFANCGQIEEIEISGAGELRVPLSKLFSPERPVEVDLSKGVTVIGSESFSNFTQLKEVSIPSSVTKVEGGAFAGITKAEIEVDDDNRNIRYSRGAFYSYDRRTLFAVLPMSAKFSIPESVRTISANAFKGNDVVQEIVIPEDIKEIEGGAFLGCASLKKIRYEGEEPINIGSDKVVEDNVVIEVPEDYEGDSLFGHNVVKKDDDDDDDNDGLSKGGAIALGVSLSVVCIIAVIVVVIICLKRKKSSDSNPKHKINDYDETDTIVQDLIV